MIHCAAGVHRAGIVSYILLRWTNLDPKQAYDTIKGINKATQVGVGEWRIKIVEETVVLA